MGAPGLASETWESTEVTVRILRVPHPRRAFVFAARVGFNSSRVPVGSIHALVAASPRRAAATTACP